MLEVHKDLEFGPPERNTLRPLRVVLPELRVCSLSPRGRICELRELPQLVPLSIVRALPFICLRGARTQSGGPTCGPGDVL